MEPQDQPDRAPPEPMQAKPTPRKHARRIDCGRDPQPVPRPSDGERPSGEDR